MHFRSIALALFFSAIAGAVVAATAMPPAAMFEKPYKAANASQRHYADCHRSVRTHRIFGALIRHRHVGNNCAVREVKQLHSK